MLYALSILFYLFFVGKIKLKIRPEGGEKVRVAISWEIKKVFQKREKR